MSAWATRASASARATKGRVIARTDLHEQVIRARAQGYAVASTPLIWTKLELTQGMDKASLGSYTSVVYIVLFAFVSCSSAVVIQKSHLATLWILAARGFSDAALSTLALILLNCRSSRAPADAGEAAPILAVGNGGPPAATLPAVVFDASDASLVLRSVVYFAFLLAWYGSLRYVPVGLAIAIMYTGPAVTVPLCAAALGERVPRGFWLLFALMLAGVALIARPWEMGPAAGAGGDGPAARELALGVGCALGGVLAMSVVTLLTRAGFQRAAPARFTRAAGRGRVRARARRARRGRRARARRARGARRARRRARRAGRARRRRRSRSSARSRSSRCASSSSRTTRRRRGGRERGAGRSRCRSAASRGARSSASRSARAARGVGLIASASVAHRRRGARRRARAPPRARAVAGPAVVRGPRASGPSHEPSAARELSARLRTHGRVHRGIQRARRRLRGNGMRRGVSTAPWPSLSRARGAPRFSG